MTMACVAKNLYCQVQQTSITTTGTCTFLPYITRSIPSTCGRSHDDCGAVYAHLRAFSAHLDAQLISKRKPAAEPAGRPVQTIGQMHSSEDSASVAAERAAQYALRTPARTPVVQTEARIADGIADVHGVANGHHAATDPAAMGQTAIFCQQWLCICQKGLGLK